MEAQRIDKWLWFARFCKSRSLAQTWIGDGLVWCNGERVVKASASLRPGDEIVFRQGRIWRRVAVVAMGERRGPAPEAATLYDLLPPPDPPPEEWP
ncbi:MAG: RNA-binding S4 domain-containing protein [Telmatospirillum sp.]|nr:RNA-binding S4 domain-containing protein [Telmatospirillum sp.]